MIRRLRWKFILINLLLVGLVLTVVFVLLLTSNARRLADQGSAALHMALNRGTTSCRPGLRSARRRSRRTATGTPMPL